MFTPKKIKWFVYVVLLLSIIAIIKKHNFFIIDKIKEASIVFFSKFEKISTVCKSNFYNFKLYFGNIHSLKKENELLKRKLKKFELLKNEHKVCYEEKKRLYDILHLQERYSYKTLPAEIILREFDNWNKVVIINKGNKHNIKKGAPVVNSQGIVGRIFSVYDNTSKVLLLTDIESSISAKINRTSEIGILTGKNINLFHFEIYKKNVDIKKGDIITTSGISEHIPPNIMIGKVVKIQSKEKGLSTIALVRPSVEFDKISKLLVIVDKK